MRRIFLPSSQNQKPPDTELVEVQSERKFVELENYLYISS
jgi:hypothetical protein